MRIIFVRHGHPDYDNDCLTESGHIQAEKVAKRLEDEEICHVYSSSCGRAYETAEHIAKVHNLDVEACDFIRETAWGTTEGEPLAHNGHPWYTAKDMVTEGLDILSPDWENEEPFCRNKILETAKVAWQGFDELLEKLGFKREGKYYRVCEENDKNYVVVSHGGASTAVISHLLNLPLPFFYKSVQLDFTSVTIIALKGDKGQLTSPKIELLNDSRHAEIIDIEWKY